jgi:hypothetical protein
MRWQKDYLLLLNSLIHKECSSKSGLLRNLKNILRHVSIDGNSACPYLLCFYCMCELGGKGDVCDRYVVQNKVESERAASEVLPDESRDLHRKSSDITY